MAIVERFNQLNCVRKHHHEMIFYNLIQLPSNLRKLLIQIQSLHRDLIPAHLVHIVWDKVFISLGVQKHPRHLMPGAFKFRFLVFT